MGVQWNIPSDIYRLKLGGSIVSYNILIAIGRPTKQIRLMFLKETYNKVCIFRFVSYSE
jgi:hypothetical protein